MPYHYGFLKSLEEKQLSKKTIKDYKYIFEAFKKHFQNDDIKNLSENEIQQYFKLLKKRKISDSYYHKIISSIIKYFSYLEDKRVIFLNPLSDYKLPKCTDILNPVLTQKEIENILDNIRTDKDLCIKGKAIIELCYSSALRPREIYNLKLTDIDFKKGLLFIEQSKNRKDRILPVGKQALKWVKKYIQQIRSKYINNKSHNYVFISHRNGEKLTVFGIRWAIQQTLRLSGFNPIKPYSLRSTSATVLFLNGMNIACISKLLGHTVLKTTQRYIRIKTLELKNVMDKKHPRLKLKNNRGGKNNEV